MESTLVNARIARAKKEASAGILETLGATTSELINSAYDYLLENKQLPMTQKKPFRNSEAFASFIAQSTLEVNWGKHPEIFDYKEFMSEQKRADYESLA